MKRKTFALFHSIRTDCGVLALALQQKYRSEEKNKWKLCANNALHYRGKI